jgi:hypothetical protein
MLAALVVCQFIMQVFDEFPDDGCLPLLSITFPVTCTTFGVNRVFDLTLLEG